MRARSADCRARHQPVRQSRRVARAPAGVELAEEPRNRRLDDRRRSSIQLPRGRMRVSRGAGIASVTMTRVTRISRAAFAASSLACAPASGREFRRTELEIGLRHRLCVRRRTPATPAAAGPLGRRGRACGRAWGRRSACTRRAGSPRYSCASSTALSSTVPPAIASSAQAGPADKRQAESSDRGAPQRRLLAERITMVGIGRWSAGSCELKRGKRIRRRGAEIAEAPRRLEIPVDGGRAAACSTLLTEPRPRGSLTSPS